MTDQPACCPRCGTILQLSPTASQWWAVCPQCGLGMMELRSNCPICGELLYKHALRCLISTRIGPRVLCPLCGAGRHRKDKTLSHLACSWRQWAMATGQMTSNDADALTPDRTPENMMKYLAWMAQHPNLPAGSVPAERIFRHRIRDHGTLFP